MSVFTEFFNKGIESANEVEKQKREIEEVFVDLDKEILEATQGVIRVELKESTKIDIWGEKKSAVEFLKDHTALIAIVLKQNNREKSYELAEVKTADNGGFPCRIIFDNKSNDALDKESLIMVLQDLLSSPKTGMLFSSLLKHYNEVRSDEIQK